MAEDPLIHPDRITEKPIAFEGKVDLDDFPRLAQSLADGRIDLKYKVIARLDRQRRKVVSCIIEGFVFLTCQTTLEAFRHGISIDDRLVLVDDESLLPPIEEESDEEDYVVSDGPLDVRSLIEDAVLLALPMVPRKPGLDEGREAGTAKEPRESPFAKLASLKRRP